MTESALSDDAGDDDGLTREERRERRRRRRAARVFDTSVPSPCISVCQIDDTTGLCLGCRRTLDEIRDWLILTAEEKRALLAKLAERGGPA
ncbi:Protein of unknown function [Tistlia consotensis]|uniref:Uncharacterized protein n=1 Tax=Tistlia consotensis USBA 355 TaxID=560819 RepID=A0A1Y6B5N7_9PROT|nr:DUF1289 domain-containing protein [Tistlia consotensis]SME93555.1 Protein of unknown function [Tistlia consotensis USBA 355]SNR28702.1 Protein of unknown function [Tistlia consotensis]